MDFENMKVQQQYIRKQYLIQSQKTLKVGKLSLNNLFWLTKLTLFKHFGKIQIIDLLIYCLYIFIKFHFSKKINHLNPFTDHVCLFNFCFYFQLILYEKQQILLREI